MRRSTDKESGAGCNQFWNPPFNVKTSGDVSKLALIARTLLFCS